MPSRATTDATMNSHGPGAQGRSTSPAIISAASSRTTRSAAARRSSGGPIRPAAAKQNGGSAPTTPACTGVSGTPSTDPRQERRQPGDGCPQRQREQEQCGQHPDGLSPGTGGTDLGSGTIDSNGCADRGILHRGIVSIGAVQIG